MNYTEEDVERVARALFAKEHEKLEGWTWEKETGGDPSKRDYWMESARAALSSIPRQNVPEWRTMDTLPDEGVDVLVADSCFPKDDPIIAHRYDGSPTGWVTSGEWLVPPPSHWMPLPAPPHPKEER